MQRTHICSSSSSFPSISSHHSSLTSATFLSQPKRDASCLDLTLGLSTSAFQHHHSSSSSSREKNDDSLPIKPFMRITNIHRPAFFVKVDMEGFTICRKLNLLAQDGYDSLISTLRRMFTTSIIYPDAIDRMCANKYHHVLTYQDKEGDWMMVGDLPWKMFLTDVKRMKIRRAAKYSC